MTRHIVQGYFAHRWHDLAAEPVRADAVKIYHEFRRRDRVTRFRVARRNVSA